MGKIDPSRLYDKEYRLNNLYWIVDKGGNSIQFNLNETQAKVLKSLTNKNLILKARQLGMSTFCVLYLLDEVIFNENISAGIVSYSLPHAQHIFKNIVGHAIDKFPKELGSLGITAKSTKEINFDNGSSLRVDTSLRGGTTQLVLVTEFGKTCARSPIRSDEIIAGTLESVPADGLILIESTGEGTSGPFAEMCLSANARGNENLTEFDYKLHFFPWYLDDSYEYSGNVLISPKINDYFADLEENLGLTFSIEKKRWYQKKWELLGDKMQQEYPSTVEESFISNSDAYYFAAAIQDARKEDRIVIGDLYDPLLPVYAIADIGVTHPTVFTFLQIQHGERRVIDTYYDTNKGLDFYASFLLKDKPYVYDTIYLPHDAARKNNIIVENSYKSEFEKLVRHTGTKVEVLPRTDKNANIANALNGLRRTVFSESRCVEYLEKLGKYRRQWSEQLGRYLDRPMDDETADFADSFIYAMQAAEKLEKKGATLGARERHKDALAARSRRI